MVFGTFVSCVKENEPENTEKQTEENEATEKQTDKKETTDSEEPDTDTKDSETDEESQEVTETETATETETETEAKTDPKPDYDRFVHSETYNRAKQKWSSVWNRGVDRKSEMGFLTKPAPFKFLSQQGVVYYNDDGEPRAYGTDDNFDNYKSIQSKGWIDPKTEENDFYLLTQYISAPIYEGNSNGETYVATYMLKYILEDDCYRDLLLLSGDFRSNLLIQQIDQEYTPELISKTLIRYDLIREFGLFYKLPYSGVDQYTMDYYKEDVCNYVSNIDYENLTITVNYNNPSNQGNIYSYTYKLKESPSWDQVLIGSEFTAPKTKEERDALTNEQIMRTYQGNVGTVLYDVRAFAWALVPSDEQKATASVKYEFDYLALESIAASDRVNRYESGAIRYSQVNELTLDYVSNLRSK